MWGAAIGTILAALSVYRYNTGKLDRNNKNLLELYKKRASKLRPVNKSGDEFKFRLRDYYIASSYNSCCGNDRTHFLQFFVELLGLIDLGKQMRFSGHYPVFGEAV